MVSVSLSWRTPAAADQKLRSIFTHSRASPIWKGRSCIRTDLLVTEEIAESSDLRVTPFEFERAKRLEAALSILEGKWKIVILNRLFARPIWRFSELERAVPGISQRMLSQQLRLLEKCELVID